MSGNVAGFAANDPWHALPNRLAKLSLVVDALVGKELVVKVVVNFETLFGVTSLRCQVK